MNSLFHEGMALFCKYEVVGDTDGDCFWQDYGIYEERVEGSGASDVEVHIDAAIMVQDEVADGVCTLDGICIVVKGIEEPRVMLGDKLAGTGVCP